MNELDNSFINEDMKVQESTHICSTNILAIFEKKPVSFIVLFLFSKSKY